jgi:exodeoxyribonuclease VII large subunit
LEDLWAFNEEIVVRAAAVSGIPLISAVGHETDTTLIDFVSDRRAPTPTAAAEIAVPVKRELELRLTDIGQRMEKARDRYFSGLFDKISGLSRGIPTPRDILGLAMQKLDDFSLRLGKSIIVRQEARVQSFKGLSRTLETLSYHGVLKRGFAVIRDNAGKTVVTAGAAPSGKALDIEFKDGHVPVMVKGGSNENENQKARPKKAPSSAKNKGPTKDQGKLF